MSSKTEICNIAISHIGTGKPISNLDEKSEEARACKLFYDIALKNVLEDFPWGFARSIATLGLVEENPNKRWDYSYRYPNDCVAPVRILSDVDTDTDNTVVEFENGSDGSGRLIFTDRKEAELEYTKLINNPNIFSPSFIIALSYKIAFYIAPRLSKGDQFKIQRDLGSQYASEIQNARVNAGNSELGKKDRNTPTIRSRY